MTSQQLFEKFVAADDALESIGSYQDLKQSLLLSQSRSYSDIQQALIPKLSYKQKQLFTTLDKRWAMQKAKPEHINDILISGAGPCGLRAAAEALTLGHRVTIVELRTDVSRHNILKTWRCTIEDLRSFGLSHFLPSFKVHGHLHLGTREIQLCLLKFCLLFGATVQFGRGVCGLKQINGRWSAWTLPSTEARSFIGRKAVDLKNDNDAALSLKAGETDTSKLEQVSKVDFFEKAESENGAIVVDEDLRPEYFQVGQYVPFHSLLVAEGESSKLIRRLGFDRKVAKYNEAIGIVVNMEFSAASNTRTGQIEEFVVWRASADWKNGPLGWLFERGIELENLEYMRGTRTHFLAASTKLQTLQKYGVIKAIKGTVRETLIPANLDVDKLRELGRSLAECAGIPADSPFAPKNGVQVFDFSCKGVCVQPFRWLPGLDQCSLVLPIGDALQNPFWPQGLGVNRGFHNALDGVWAAHVRAMGSSTEDVERERVHAFRSMEWFRFAEGLLLPADKWTADPLTRYSADIQKSIHMQDIEKKATASSLPPRYLASFK